MSSVILELQRRFPNLVSDEPSLCQKYGRDWTRFEEPSPCGVAFPRSASEVVELLGACTELGVAVVPSGGRTGLSGGAVASQGELVLSLDHLQRVGTVDPFGLTVEVGSGVVTQAVHQQAAEVGLTWPIDLAAKGSSTIGGNLATNAGGLRVIRYGHARHWVTGLEVATMNGQLLRMGGAVLKNNTGPDLSQLFIGSEGILGVITAATLRLTPLPSQACTGFFALNGPGAALELLCCARTAAPTGLGHGLTLQAFEYISPECLEAVCGVGGLRPPLGSSAPAYVLVECENRLAEFQSWATSMLERGLVLDGVVAATAKEAAKLWSYRERITESLGSLGLMHKNDVAVPVAEIPRFLEQFRGELAPRYPGRCYLFGHLGDGNIHVNVMKQQEQQPQQFLRECRQVDAELYQLIQSHGGSIAAEHGIGKLKRQFLHFSRSPEVIAQMRLIKRLFDPQGLLNPGKVLPE